MMHRSIPAIVSQSVAAGGGVPVIESWLKTTMAEDTNPMIIYKPTGIVAGDLGLIIFTYYSSSANPDPFLSISGGWTKRLELSAGTANYCRIVVWTKTLGASEGNPTISHAVLLADVAWYLRISGANNADPWNASANANAYNQTINLGVTTDEPNTLGLIVRTTPFFGGHTYTISGNSWTREDTASSGGTNKIDSCWGTKDIVSAGASGNATTVAATYPTYGSLAAAFGINQAAAGGGPISIVAHNTNTNANGGSPVTVNKPAGTVAGDLLVIFAVTRNSYLAAPTGGGTWVQKWSYQTDGSSVSTAGGNERLYCWSRVAGGSEPASYSCVLTDDGTDSQVIGCIAFRNASSLGNFSANGGGAGIANSISANENDMLVMVHACSFATSAQTIGVPSGMTKQYQTQEPINSTFQCVMHEILTSTGATGSRQVSNYYTGYAYNFLLAIEP